MTALPVEEAGPLAQAFLQLPDGVLVVDKQGNIVWGNRSAERMFGRALEDWRGVSGLSLVHPDDHEFVLRAMTTVQDKDVGSPIEIRLKAATGWRLIELVGTVTTWEGEPAILLSMRDLTERRRFELAQGHEARFRSLVHNAGSVIMLVSPDGVIESVSGGITRSLGHDPELIEHRPLLDIVAEGDRLDLEAAVRTALSSGASSAHPVTIRVGLLRHDGATAVPFELSIVNLVDDPTVEGFVISAHDATDQVAAELEVNETLSRLTATLDSTADGILVVNTKGEITNFNHRFIEIWRMPEESVVEGNDVSTLEFAMDQLSEPEDLRNRHERVVGIPETETFDTLEFLDGRIVERYSRPQRVAGTVVGRVYSFRDITDRTRLEDELAYRAFHDSLTGLANKALFQDRLEHALARTVRTGSNLAVMFIDLDDFKTVNDSLGHGEGDRLLQRVATTIVRALGPSDTAARLGGDEFAVLVEDVRSRDSITALAGRILDSLRPAVRLGTKSVNSTGSIGIAFDEQDITSEQLLRNADIAMYRAKSMGKNRSEVYREEMHALVLARIELENELRTAIFAGDLLAHYQPIVDLHSRSIVGFEALVRWKHPDGGLVDPRLFIPLAEELGLVGEIDSFVLRAATEQATRWRDSGLSRPDLMMSVNLSPGQLAEEDFAGQIARQVADSRFDPHSLILEITESAILSDDELTRRNLAELRATGVRIALDDFGTGYASLSHLDRLQIDIVKIDRSFVKHLGGPKDARSMAAAMLQLARTLGYDIIAEGVERPAQEDGLRTLGCNLAQGYYLGKPLGAVDTGRMLAASDGGPLADRRRGDRRQDTGVHSDDPAADHDPVPAGTTAPGPT